MRLFGLGMMFMVLQFSGAVLLIVGGAVATASEQKAQAPTIFTYRSAESDLDARYDYDLSLLTLALDKTVKQYGPYTLEPSGGMNFARAIHLVETNQKPNFFIKLSYEKQFSSNLVHTSIPIDLGIVGYRVCFISPQADKRLSSKPSLAELKRLLHGQGKGWADVKILESNGFQVFENSSYEGLFLMVANNRVDLFCRGVNELYDEFHAHKSIPGLQYDKRFVLYYPLPRFFYTHRDNIEALERISLGLSLAFEDGSLQKLWRSAYQTSIEFSQLSQRELIPLENPTLEALEPGYQDYFYQIDSTHFQMK